MKTSIIEHILEPTKQRRRRRFLCSSIGSRSCIAGLLMLALSWSLVIPFRAQANIVDRKPLGTTTRTFPQSETFSVYGPHRIDRLTWQPVNVVENFSIPSDAAAPF